MAITKFASFEISAILDIKGSPGRVHTASLDKLADFENFRTDDGYLYVRIRAISSRVNKNHDSWPSSELAGSADLLDRHHSGSGFTVEASDGDQEYGFATFMGKPVFVDHHNSDPKKARGVIVDAKLNVLSKDAAHHDSYWGGPGVDSLHMPPTEVELLLEIDAKSFPKLAQAIVKGDLDGFSMGCFVAGTPITLNDGTRKPIEKITVGEEVLTHNGLIESVVATMTRQYDGDLYHVDTYGQAQRMSLTAEHPVWVTRSDQSRWIAAKDLRIGDYVLTPRMTQTHVGDSDNRAWARLVGFYLAEGNLGYDKKRYSDGRPVFVEWNFHVDEIDYIESVKRDLGELGYATCGPYIKNNCATIRCNSPELAASFLATAGQHSWGKKLAPSVLQWNEADQAALLDSYFGGDGHSRKEGKIEVGTASEDLAYQIFALANRVGYRMTPPRQQHSPSASKKRPKYSMHVETQNAMARPSYFKGYLDPNGLWREITQVEREHFVGAVYNFDVHGPDSYVASDIAVHNCDVEYSQCSHCNHIARSADEYCSHILMKGAHHDYKTADGDRVSKKSFEHCFGCKFFEISAVFDPADETAKAREVRAGVYKEADIQPTIQPDPLRPQSEEVMDLASRLVEQQGVSMDSALEIAEQMLQQQRGGLPGHGEGGSIEDFNKQWNYSPMPSQMPPAVRGGPPDNPFGQAAEQALNQQWPNRPVQNDPHWSHKTAEHPLPQEFMTRAPEEVDTLRDEKLCPICGNDMDSETCTVCFPPGTLIRTARGYQPIEEIKTGDLVLSAEGQYRRVADVMEREYEGVLKRLDSPGLVEPILVTDNHPFSVLVGDEHNSQKKESCKPARCDRWDTFENTHSLHWVHAGCLHNEHFVATNVPQEEIDVTEIEVPLRYITNRYGHQWRRGPVKFELTNDFLWAIGLYLAEGNAGSRFITYSSHRNEVEYQDRIRTLFEGYGYTTRLDHRADKPNSAWVHIHSSVLAEWLPAWLGDGCDQKQIPAELLNLPLHKLTHLYQGYLDGDGCTKGNSAKTTSPILALQVAEIAQRLGVNASIQIEHPVGKRTAYTVNNVTDVKRDYWEHTSERRSRYPRNTWQWRDHTLYRLTNVDDVPYTGKVYNLSVEGHPTYTVQNLLVHNCGYVTPPEEFNNPDLDKAKEIRQEMKTQEEAQATPGAQPGQPGQPGDQIGQPNPNSPGGGPLTSQMPTKAPATAGVTNEMRWTPKVHPKTAARINQIERPVTTSNPIVSDEPRNEVVVKDQTTPVTASVTPTMLTAQRLMTNAQRNHGETMNTRTADGATPPGDTSPKTRVDVTGVGGVDEASNDAASKADAQVDVTGVGTTGVSDVSADKSESLPAASRDGDDSGFNTDKTTDDSGPTSTFGDSDGGASGVGEPVTHEPFPASADGVKAAYRHAYDDKTLEQNEQQGDPIAQGGKAVQGVQPIAEQFGERVNVLDHTTSPSNNSGPTTTWTGTDGNGVLKQQDPITHDKMEWGGVPVPDVQLHTTGRVSIAALRLAEAEVELGLITPEQKWNRMAEHDADDPQKVVAQLETLARVKTAGLKQLSLHRQSGVTRMPKAFGRNTAAPNGFERIATGAEQVAPEPVTNDSLDAALFMK